MYTYETYNPFFGKTVGSPERVIKENALVAFEQ